MTAKNFSVNQDKKGTYHVQGEVSIHELEEFNAFLEESLKDEEEIAISLAEVRFIDTPALQLLIAYKRRMEPKVKMRISAVSPEVEEILSLGGLKTALM